MISFCGYLYWEPKVSIFVWRVCPLGISCYHWFWPTISLNNTIYLLHIYILSTYLPQGLAVDIEPWLNKSEPDDMTWLQQKEKKLKELRSQLRHRLADLDDLTEVLNKLPLNRFISWYFLIVSSLSIKFSALNRLMHRQESVRSQMYKSNRLLTILHCYLGYNACMQCRSSMVVLPTGILCNFNSS